MKSLNPQSYFSSLNRHSGIRKLGLATRHLDWTFTNNNNTATLEPELQRRQRAFPSLTSYSFGQAIYQIGQAITAANEYVTDETTSKMVDLVISDMDLGRQQIKKLSTCTKVYTYMYIHVHVTEESFFFKSRMLKHLWRVTWMLNPPALLSNLSLSLFQYIHAISYTRLNIWAFRFNNEKWEMRNDRW